jgi:hypothetical protein
MTEKPVVQLSGTDGNIFALVGEAKRALRKAGMAEQAEAMAKEVFDAGSYYQALSIIQRYVDTE